MDVSELQIAELRKGIEDGLFTPNEVRGALGLTPVEGGDGSERWVIRHPKPIGPVISADVRKALMESAIILAQQFDHLVRLAAEELDKEMTNGRL